jgi:hypothetical protein
MLIGPPDQARKRYCNLSLRRSVVPNLQMLKVVIEFIIISDKLIKYNSVDNIKLW